MVALLGKSPPNVMFGCLVRRSLVPWAVLYHSIPAAWLKCKAARSSRTSVAYFLLAAILP